MKNKFSRILLVALGLLVQFSASAFTTAVGYGTSNTFPAAAASSTFSSGTTEFTISDATSVALTSATMFTGATYSAPKLGNSSNDGTTFYVEGALTSNSATSTISALQIGATFASTSTGLYAVSYSSVYPFSTSSIISTQTLTTTSNALTTATYATATVPATAKSFRIYRKVTLSGTAYGAGTSTYIFYVGVTVTPSGPTVSLTSGSATQSGMGTVAIATPIVYTSTVTTNVPTITWGSNGIPSGVSVVTDATAQTLTISGTPANVATTTVYDYTVTVASGNTLSGSITVTPYTTPAPSFVTTSNTAQSQKANVAISDIVYTISNATDATVSGLPTGVTGSYNAGVFTITGTPGTETTYPAVYTYTVTPTALSTYTGSAVTTTGTITVLDPSKKYILYIASSAYLTAYASKNDTDKFLTNLNANSSYVVTSRAPLAASAVTSTTYSLYDLIILHETLTGGDAASSTSELSTIKSVDKPILNTKAYFYGGSDATTRWKWGVPSNGDKRAAINVTQSTHPIFSGITAVGDSVVLFSSYVAKNIQPTTIPVGGFAVAVTSSASNVAIHELPAATRSVSANSKYILVSLLSTQFGKLTTDALTLLNNSVTYLLGTTTFVPVYSTDATLSAITVGGTALTGFNAATLTYDVALASGTTTVPVVAATTTATVATKAIVAATALPGSTTITVTAQDGTTKKVYTINFTVVKSTDATLSAITVDGTPLSGFASATTTYNVELAAGTTTIPVVAGTTTATVASASVTQASALPGAATINVTAEDGTTTQVYTINFTVIKSTDATLKSLAVGTSSITLVTGTYDYAFELPSSTTAYPSIVAVQNNASAVVATETYTGTFPTGKASILVTAESGATQTYTIQFSQAVAKSTDATLSAISVNGTDIASFAAGTTTYDVALPAGTTTIPTVAGTTNSIAASASVTQATAVTGSATITVTAEDGTTTLTYTINFTVAKSTDATLSAISVNGTDIASFAAGTTTYDVVLPAGTTTIPTVVGTTTSSVASASVTPAATVTGSATITVTAEDGTTTKVYTINFTVATELNNAKSAAKVYATGSSIIVEGAANATASVVSLAGNVVYTGVITDSKETLPVSLQTGVYAVLVNGVSTKVLVK